jgi:hypothetical protein
MLATVPQEKLQLDYVTRELPLGWTPDEAEELLRALQPYVRWIESYLASGVEIPSHIPQSGSIAVPIGETTTPEALFGALGQQVTYHVHEYDEFWVTVHYPNPEPVVTLLPKKLPGLPDKLVELCERCSAELGVKVGGIGGMFLAWLLPRFSWAMHTDHDNKYEMVSARVQYPLFTTPRSLFVWGQWDDEGEEEWLLTKHLPAGKAHYVRVDVPHTVINAHPTRPRLHLILDVQDA